jgi:rhamnose utilization protein RhaD (predicted bifunctional aldolase and dehydrogenase)
LKSRWEPHEAARCKDVLALRAYSSRLLGADPNLVLHGGGNTSVKVLVPGPVEERDILYVKGSGSDLATVEPADFTPLPMGGLRSLLERDELESGEMHTLLADMLAQHPAPKPSVETLLHAALPFRYIEHTHADAVLALSNTENGARTLADLYGDLAPIAPYRHSGFELARACAEAFRCGATDRTIGLILRFHGVVAFGDDARASYENMIRLADMAEAYLEAHGAWTLPAASHRPAPDRLAVARLRASICRAAGFPLLMQVARDPFALHFASRPDLDELCSHGPATPQHAIFARRVPLVGDALQPYIDAYRAYLAASLAPRDAAGLDPTPRIVVHRSLGVCALGIDAEHARIAAEIFRHDMEIMVRAQAHDRYRSAPAALMARAELEYGGFEVRERRRAASTRPRLGQIAIVTAGAALAEPMRVAVLLEEGAAVALVGRPPVGLSPHGTGVRVFRLEDDTSAAWEALLDEVVLAFGGADLLVASSGDAACAERCAPLLALSPIPR